MVCLCPVLAAAPSDGLAQARALAAVHTDILAALGIPVHKRVKAVVSTHHGLGVGVYDGGSQPAFHCHGKERGIDDFPLGQSEGYVGYPQHGSHSQLVPDTPQRLQGGKGPPAVGTDRHAESVQNDILRSDSVLRCPVYDFPSHGQTSLCRIRNTGLVQTESHCHPAVFCHQRKDAGHGLFLAVDRVNQRFPVVDAHGPFHGFHVRGVDLKGQVDDGLKLPYSLLHHGWLVDFR